MQGVEGVAAGGGYRGDPYKKNGDNKTKKKSVQGPYKKNGGQFFCARGPIKKMGVNIYFFLQLSRVPEGPSR